MLRACLAVDFLTVGSVAGTTPTSVIADVAATVVNCQLCLQLPSPFDVCWITADMEPISLLRRQPLRTRHCVQPLQPSIIRSCAIDVLITSSVFVRHQFRNLALLTPSGRTCRCVRLDVITRITANRRRQHRHDVLLLYCCWSRLTELGFYVPFDTKPGASFC